VTVCGARRTPGAEGWAAGLGEGAIGERTVGGSVVGRSSCAGCVLGCRSQPGCPGGGAAEHPPLVLFCRASHAPMKSQEGQPLPPAGRAPATAPSAPARFDRKPSWLKVPLPGGEGYTRLKEMTKRFSSEFDIRFFLLKEPERTLSILKIWAHDSNHHVRRLVSEGTRPRLPWAMRLPAFIDAPTPILPLLEMLKDDDEEYVRRSVANNLNDIAKDHPDKVAQIAGRWLDGASKNREKLVRHACRTLIKQGHQKTLKALGYEAPRIKLEKLKILTARVSFGDALMFELCLTSTSKKAQPLIIDYAIHHRKANGGTTAKIFKWKKATLAPLATFKATRKHAFRKITTRVYYPGVHKLEIRVNGISLGSKNFALIM